MHVEHEGWEGEGGEREGKQDSQTQRDVPISILIILLKHIRHPLQTDARLHEQIKTQCILPAAIVRAIQQCDKLLAEPVAKRNERFVELGVRYASAMVLIEAVEESAPGGEETP